jgi:putative transposase
MAIIEAFRGRYRAECLDAHWPPSLADARENYNVEHAHGAIGHTRPIMLLNRVDAAGPPP